MDEIDNILSQYKEKDSLAKKKYEASEKEKAQAIKDKIDRRLSASSDLAHLYETVAKPKAEKLRDQDLVVSATFNTDVVKVGSENLTINKNLVFNIERPQKEHLDKKTGAVVVAFNDESGYYISISINGQVLDSEKASHVLIAKYDGYITKLIRGVLLDIDPR